MCNSSVINTLIPLPIIFSQRLGMFYKHFSTIISNVNKYLINIKFIGAKKVPKTYSTSIHTINNFSITVCIS